MSAFSTFLCNSVEVVFGKLPPRLRDEFEIMVKQLVDKVSGKADDFVDQQIIPFLSRYIKTVYQGSPDQILKIMKLYITDGLVLFLKMGVINDTKKLIHFMKVVIPHRIITEFTKDAKDSTKRMVEQISKRLLRADTVCSVPEFLRLLMVSCCNAVIPEIRDQLLTGIDQLINTVSSNNNKKVNLVIHDIVAVLEPYIQANVLTTLVPHMTDALETIKSHASHVLKKTLYKASDRVANKVREVSGKSFYASGGLDASFSDNVNTFVEFLYDLLKNVWSDLKSEVKTELSQMVQDCRNQAAESAKKYVSETLIPKLSQLIESNVGYSPERYLKILEPYIITGLERFLKTGEIPGRDDLIKATKEFIPTLITEFAIPGASDIKKNSMNKIVRSATNTAFDSGITSEIVKNTIPVAITETLIPNASETIKEAVQKVIKSVERDVFDLGKKPSIETLFENLIDDIGDELLRDSKEKLIATVDDLVERMPDHVDQVMEFVCRNMLPALAAYFYADVFNILEPFICVAIDRIRMNGTLRGRDFITPTLKKSLQPLTKSCFKMGLIKVFGKTATASTKTATKKVIVTKMSKRVVQKVTQKYLTTKTGEKVVQKVTKKVVVKASKQIVSKMTEKVATENGVKQVVSKFSEKVTSEIATKASQVTGAKAVNAGLKVAGKVSQKASAKVSQEIGNQALQNAGTKATEKLSIKIGQNVAVKQSIQVSQKASVKVSQEIGNQALQNAGTKATEELSIKIGQNVAVKQSIQVSQKASVKVSQEVGNKALTKAGNKVTEELSTEIGQNVAVKQSVKVAGGVTKVSTKKTTQTFVKTTKTTTKIVEESTEGAVKVASKEAAKAGLTAFGVSAVVGGIFLYRDLEELEKAYNKNEIDEKEYKRKRAGRWGEYTGEAVGSGIVAAATTAAALTGPVGWAAIGVGAAFSFATGYAGKTAMSWLVSCD